LVPLPRTVKKTTLLSVLRGTQMTVGRFRPLGFFLMPSSGYLRRQADLCLRLALIASDHQASRRLLAIHQDYKAKADAIEAETGSPSAAAGHAPAPPATHE